MLSKLTSSCQIVFVLMSGTCQDCLPLPGSCWHLGSQVYLPCGSHELTWGDSYCPSLWCWRGVTPKSADTVTAATFTEGNSLESLTGPC